MRYPAPSDVEALRLEFQRRIDDGKQAEAELARLEAWLKTGESLFSEHGSGTTFREVVKFNPLSSFAEKVLKRNGRLHINTLMDHMRKEGWVSTGDIRMDMKNVYANLSKNTRFVNLGRNVWALANDGEKK